MTPSTHRPYPPPRRPWAMAMQWHDLLFMHWPVAPESLRALVPKPLRIDTYDGKAWVGVAPFRMRGVRARFLPPLPPVGAFLELNVRTYVTADERPGVWFFSLDAESRLAVEAARVAYGLNYLHARMSCEDQGGAFRYRSARDDRRGVPAELDVRYAPESEVFHARPGSFDSFLVDRYCLYSGADGGVRRAEIDHPPWPLQRARVEIARSTMGNQIGQALASTAEGVYFARSLAVQAWLPEAIGG
jgi:uncharacterized protein YqjF (DUF2071 family)